MDFDIPVGEFLSGPLLLLQDVLVFSVLGKARAVLVNHCEAKSG